MLIDGGVGQLNVALEVITTLGLEDIPLSRIATEAGIIRCAGLPR